MNDAELILNPNELVQFLKKMPTEFTSADIVAFCIEKNIEMVNFRYVAEDGRLKTLNFYITSQSYLESILNFGERVDGSSLFSFIGSGSSDLYVVPRYSTAFLNPFAEVATLEIFCSFYNNEQSESDPSYILKSHVFLPTKQAVSSKPWANLDIM